MLLYSFNAYYTYISPKMRKNKGTFALRMTFLIRLHLVAIKSNLDVQSKALHVTQYGGR